MSEYLDRFNARGAAVRSAYTNENTAPTRPEALKQNLLVDVMADLCIRAQLSDLNPQDLLHRAIQIADYEMSFVGDELRADIEQRRQVRAAS